MLGILKIILVFLDTATANFSVTSFISFNEINLSSVVKTINKPFAFFSLLELITESFKIILAA